MNTKKPQIIQSTQILMGGQNINLRARQLMYVLAALMNPEKPTDTIKIKADDFLKFINQNAKKKWSDVYSLTNDIFEHLNDFPILVKMKRKKDFIKINWLSSLAVHQGYIKARLSPDIADYFIYQKELPYTKVLWDLRIYKSAHTARLLDLLQRYRNQVTFEMEREELKSFFGLHNKYPNFGDFKKRILENARQELLNNLLAPIYFDYEIIKNGRKIVAVKFEIHTRDEVLMKLLGNYTPINSDGQISIDTSLFLENLSEEEKKYYQKLSFIKVPEPFVQMLVKKLSISQLEGCFQLVEYGVNYTLAKDIITKDCIGSELLGYEGVYTKFVLVKIENARLKRIEEVKKGTSKKRTTPKEKRGALPKKIFKERYYFAEFMEYLALKKRKNSFGKENPRSGFNSLGSLLDNFQIDLKDK